MRKAQVRTIAPFGHENASLSLQIDHLAFSKFHK